MDKPFAFQTFEEIIDGNLTFHIFTFFDYEFNQHARVTATKQLNAKLTVPDIGVKAERLVGADAVGMPKWAEIADVIEKNRLICLALLWKDEVKLLRSQNQTSLPDQK